VPAVVERAVDGDTLDLTLDLGWHISYRSRCRVVGINTPELSTEDGRGVRAYVLERCPVGTRVRFVSKALDKYGRPLGHVLLPDGVNLGELLLATGRAVPM
jgi:micrococcal nuclease